LPTGRQLDQQETPTTPTTNSLFSSGTSSRAGERERVFSTLLELEHEGQNCQHCDHWREWDRLSLEFRWNDKTFKPGNTNLPGWSFLLLGIIDGLRRYIEESQFDETNEMNSNKPFRAAEPHTGVQCSCECHASRKILG